MKLSKWTFVVLAALVASVFGLTACGKTIDENTVWEGDILVGNTAATSGGYSVVGVPFNAALEAYLAYYNAELRVDGRGKVKFRHYDDKFDSAEGQTLTEKLVEEDEVFALVGHFGTPTVGATLNYIAEQKVPMVYAATGVDTLYNKNATGGERYILPVQPIFTTEGAVFAVRAVAKDPAYGLGMTKIGVIYTDDDAGKGMKAAVESQVAEIKKNAAFEDVSFSYKMVTMANVSSEAPAAVQSLKTEGVECVIIAANQSPMVTIATAMKNVDLDVPFLTSYVNASATIANTLGTSGVLTDNRVMYTNGWVDVYQTEDVAKFKEIMEDYAELEGTGFKVSETFDPTDTKDIRNNSFAMAGYIAGEVFVQGLIRTYDQNDGKLTRAAYVDAMESASVKIAMAGTLDFSGGQRFGIDKLLFFSYTASGGFGSTILTYNDIATIMEHLEAPAA